VRRYRQQIKEMGYVCSPANFSIRMEYDMVSVKNNSGYGVNIHFLDDRDIIFSQSLITRETFNSRFIYDAILKDYLKRIFSYNRDYFLNNVLRDERAGLRFYDYLKLVQSKLGTVIYKKR